MIYECIGKRSEKPYLIRNTMTGVYSIEELLYYIRENVFMLDPSDYGWNLVPFLKEDLLLPELSEKYEALLKRDAPFAERAALLFRDTAFSSESETETLRKALAMSEHMSNNDSHRVRGDFFIQSGRTAEAVMEYEAALELIDEESAPGDAARLLEGIGKAEARDFKFGKAAEHFEKAHLLSPADPGILEKLLCAVRLDRGEEGFRKYVSDNSIPDNICDKVIKRMDNAGRNALNSVSAKELKRAGRVKKDGNYAGYVNIRMDVLRAWKKKYRG